MMNQILIDTDILIDAALTNSKAINYLEKIETHSLLSVSIVTQMELLVGCRDKNELLKTECFLKRFHVISLNEIMCETAIHLLRCYRLSHGLHIPDSLIASTAISLNIPFASKNQKHFRIIKNLQLLPCELLGN